MAKFYGTVGYAEQLETAPGVWREQITERKYYGDLLLNKMRYQGSSNLNDNLNISNEVSILADPYAIENFHKIRYVSFQGTYWKVSSVEVHYPRINLTIGDVYNEQTS